MSEGLVIIKPRTGVSAAEIVEWLEKNFMKPGSYDGGPDSMQRIVATGGNPLVNATIREVELP